MNKQRIVLAGGSGFLGRALAKELLLRNYEIVVLTRTPRPRTDGVMEFEWDGQHIGEWIRFLNDAEAVVNLAGRNIKCRYTPENLRELTASRVDSVLAIAAAFGHVPRPPRVWVQAGAIGFYGDPKDCLCDENSPAGNDALAEICKQWEAAFNSAPAPRTRRVLLRIGFVLGRDGGALPVLAGLAKWFLGGTVGSGEQFISWIHAGDLSRMFIEAIERDELAGTFNAVGPNPVTNREFMRELRRALHRPWSPPAPEWAVQLGSRLMGAEPSLALAGCRVAPRRFLEAGFKFQFSDLRGALEETERRLKVKNR
jgi:uncharacterized protein (TIGR01777 family)